ncbi:secreted protein containing FAD dependent oxidoreductase domain protein [Rhodopirellula maiorica SM1]|uniref:Secreted protein containing FAD dependent oxidoreductase domain protein n=1 Tax=Rhodopirellula maiorica SM1 TaxID=1265738 RepID=M5RTG9_9BACT|nr:FAD-dependent oxidoreductase [Rhodopirellula maiorica]EMI22638.1 secreted protein containing FAD dependent oxidoreductase domain protein [Rhodopirellula maiorica SM1]
MIRSAHKGSAIVVGAGTIGIACAHYLNKAGLKVTVIDRGTVASACSHGNCGYICPSHVPPLTEPGAFGVALKSLFNPQAAFRVKPRLSPAMWNWMWQFARRCNHRQVLTAGKHLQSILDASMDEYQNLVQQESLDCEWKENGLLYVLQTQRGMDAFAKNDRMLTEHFGVSANRIDGDQLPEFEPGLKPGLAGAFHYPKDTSVRPDRLNQQWADRLRASGVQLIEHCELSSVHKTAGHISHVSTTQGELQADHYVFAMGAWSTRWSNELHCSIPIEPGKGYSVTMNRVENVPSHPILFPEHKVGVSPFETGLRLGSMMEFAGYDTSIRDQRIQQLRDSARPYLVASVDGEAKETWYGWRPMTWDSLPIIGATPNLDNAFLATGHNMLGLSLAPSTGRLIAELVTRQPPHIDAAPFSPSRF